MILESRKLPMLLLHLIGAAAGLALMYLARGFTWGVRSNEFAGFLLGCLILGISLAAMAVGESRRVELDEAGQQVILEVTSRFGRKRLVFPFADIQDIHLGRQGAASEGSVYYDLVLQGRDGRETHLFGGCVFEGRMSRDWVEGLRGRFLGALREGRLTGS